MLRASAKVLAVPSKKIYRYVSYTYLGRNIKSTCDDVMSPHCV